MSRLPIGQFDGQLFIDAFRVEWRFDASVQCWRRKGRVGSIPVADSSTTGLLSSELKFLLDKVPPKGGGFALVTRPHLQFRSQDNPDGVLFGDMELTSETLDIKCVHGDGREIEANCLKVCFNETDELPPGFDINFSDKFLRTVCVEVPGGPGLPGEKGLKGLDGMDGTGDGPVGLKGLSGKDATVQEPLVGIRVIDTENITDTAVTRLELDQDGGKLYVTKGKIKVPDNEEAEAHRIITAQINRGIKFTGDCFDYRITMLPCRPDDDYDLPDPTIAVYPSHFDPQKLNDRSFQPVKRRLSDLVNDLVAYYQKKLDEAADKYDKQVEEYIKERDKEARLILDELGDRLAQCENITYLDYCIGLGETCVEEEGEPTPVVELPATTPDCAAVAEGMGKQGADCRVITTMSVRGDSSPVFSFEAPEDFNTSSSIPTLPGGQTEYELICPDGCWTQRGGALAFVPRRGVVAPGWTPIPKPNDPNAPEPRVESRVRGVTQGPIDPDDLGDPNAGAVTDLANRLRQGVTLYRRQQFSFSALSSEFPAGNFAFVYQGGAFRQDRLSRSQAFAENTNNLIQGAFQEFFVGAEGENESLAPLYVLNPTNSDQRDNFSNDLASTKIGLEIGFAPSSRFKNLLPEDYFETHAFDPAAEVGNNAVDLPNQRVDFEGLSAAIKQDEAAISWKPFPVISANHTDLASVQNAYLDGFIQNRMVVWMTREPGFFFARVKLAYSAANFYGVLVMPPVKSLPVRPASMSKANLQFTRPITVGDRQLLYPVLNARPIATGEVKIQIVQVDEPEATPSSVEVESTTAVSS